MWCTKLIQQSLTVSEGINSVITMCLQPLCSYKFAQQKKAHANRKYSLAALLGCYWNSLSLSFCFPAFPQAGRGESRLCSYHQYLNGWHPQTVHQWDLVCALEVLQWMKGLLDPDLNKNNICIINPGLLLQIHQRPTSEHYSAVILHFLGVNFFLKPCFFSSIC